ncbi:MAG: two component transcriptional regulator, LuxR family [Dehalococcoidales bacterium]|nr:two component transcriptional regulator, LuxR family [Dehalococcoidales bacterium]
MLGTSVFVIADEPLFREGIFHALTSATNIMVAGDAPLSENVISTLEVTLCEVAVIDIGVPPFFGLDIARTIRRHLPRIALVVITPDPDDSQLFEAVKIGASAYLSRTITSSELVATIARIASGGCPIDDLFLSKREVATRVLHEFQNLTSSGIETLLSPLTHRETQVLNCVVQGYPNKQIGMTLGISENTVKTHVSSILAKLNVNARTQAIAKAVQQGLITLPERS